MREVGGYLLEKSLGRGATAQVFLAHPKADPRTSVALKVFHPGLWDQELSRRRAMGEFLTISSLKHPNIVQVLEPLWETDPPAVALEYIDGPSLEEFQGRLPYVLPEVAVLVMIELLSALEYAHEHGVVHRDLKPANILIEKSGRVLVSDFGLAKMTDASRLTMSGTVLGSPDYMAPEQARGDVSTPQSDLFSAAAILYFLVTGTRPFSRHTPLATLAAVCECQYEPATQRNPKLSAALAAIIYRGLSKTPADRFKSAAEFKTTLETYLASLGLTQNVSRDYFNFSLWIKKPSETVLCTLNLVAQQLILRCEKEITEHQWNEGFQTLSHLSLVAPESAALPRLMSALQEQRGRQGRLRWVVPAAIGCLSVLVGTIALVIGIQKDRPVPPSTAVTAPAPLRTQKPASQPTMAKKKSTTKPLVKFDVLPGTQVFWDGKKVDVSRPLRGERVGKHRIRLEREGLEPINQVIRVSADEPTVIRVR